MIVSKLLKPNLGDRLQSLLNGTTTTYSLDLNSGLTQVLGDGTNTYTYGFNRILQVSEFQTGYFLGDALGSVRQVLDPQAEILLVQSYWLCELCTPIFPS